MEMTHDNIYSILFDPSSDIFDNITCIVKCISNRIGKHFTPYISDVFRRVSTDGTHTARIYTMMAFIAHESPLQAALSPPEGDDKDRFNQFVAVIQCTILRFRTFGVTDDTADVAFDSLIRMLRRAWIRPGIGTVTDSILRMDIANVDSLCVRTRAE